MSYRAAMLRISLSDTLYSRALLSSQRCRVYRPRWKQSRTTNVLTAATLIYAIGAGITAAAGTRLALQLLLREIFTFASLQSSHSEVATSLHYLLLCRLGNLRACCHP